MTRTLPTADWLHANQRHLMARIAAIRTRLQRDVAPDDPPPPRADDVVTAALSPPAAIDVLAATFALTPFEQDVLLLCAGVELDARLGACCAAAQGNPSRPLPTFGLALATLAEPHWSALTPSAPLRRWRLLDVGPGDGLTSSPLRIDERILHYLTGVSTLDARLRGLLREVAVPLDPPATHRRLAALVRDAATRELARDDDLALINLHGADESANRAVAAWACAQLGVSLYLVHAADVPAAPVERDALVQLCARERLLADSALLVQLDESDSRRPPGVLLEELRGLVLVSSRDPVRLPGRPVARLHVQRPEPAEQQELWRAMLDPAGRVLNGQLEELVEQFSMDAETIRVAAVQVAAAAPPLDGPALGSALWDLCRARCRAGLDELAQRIEPAATWSDLVLPAAHLQSLHDIVVQVGRRAKVYRTWGFGARCSRGSGITALFAGVSGTGKTMAAEVLANELRLDLYRIDLSQVVSKYIGETEKNLRRVFEAAEDGGAILLFDEADALFGKRSEVRDSHDRFANIEVSYLLQRMEAYRGLAILTTNLKSGMDPAFLRRLRFVVPFPFPDAAQRAEIWRRAFPADTPTRNLDVERLARLALPGGNIHNIALAAAFLAADADEPIGMAHLLRAARSEYAKLERPLTESECRDWT